jgi:hypothetical protein
MKQIKLTQNRITIVDDEDYEHLSQWSWCVSSNGYVHRAERKDGKKTAIKLHSYLMSTPKGMDTDHINRNKLDNRKVNLRIVTRSKNMFNRPEPNNNSSGKKGVTWSKPARKWQAQIMISYKNNYLGIYNRLKDAVNAREEAEKRLA